MGNIIFAEFYENNVTHVKTGYKLVIIKKYLPTHVKTQNTFWLP
jgi:hypothetical protein